VTKSRPATALSSEDGGLLSRLLCHTTNVINTVRPSKLVDNSNHWNLFISTDGQRTNIWP